MGHPSSIVSGWDGGERHRTTIGSVALKGDFTDGTANFTGSTLSLETRR